MNETPAQPSPATPEASRSLLKRLAAIPTPLIFLIAVAMALALLWLQGSLGDVADAARNADLGLLIAAAIVYLISLALLAFRWHLLIKMIHGTSHLMRAAEAFLTSVVINYAAPVGLAVPTRAALTKRALGLSAAETGSIALWEVGSDLLVLGALSLIWLALSGSEGFDAVDDAASPLFIAGLILVAILAFGCFLLLVRAKKPNLWARLVTQAHNFIRMPLEYPAASARIMLSAVIYWGMQIAVLWLLLEAVGVNADARLTLGLVSVPILLGMISPTPGGAGVREALMVAMAHLYDADSSAVLLAALVYRVALFAAIPVLYAGVRLALRREHLRPTISLHDMTHPLESPVATNNEEKV